MPREDPSQWRGVLAHLISWLLLGVVGAVSAFQEAYAATPQPMLMPAAAQAEQPRLAWVNPARCLLVCAFHPGAALVRVNNRGQVDPRGRHQLDKAAADALQGLLLGARTDGHAIRIASGFRSYTDQARLFRTTKEKGRAARPGHSEHQLGTAVDLRLPNRAALDWLAGHVLDHGFTLSYPPGKQRITGYRPEPWHIRFVGGALAGELRRRGSTLEELFRSRPQLAESGTCADCPNAASRRSCAYPAAASRRSPSAQIASVSDEGTCAANVLVWCYEGALAMVDCAAFGHICGYPEGATVPDCMAAPESAAPPIDPTDR